MAEPEDGMGRWQGTLSFQCPICNYVGKDVEATIEPSAGQGAIEIYCPDCGAKNVRRVSRQEFDNAIRVEDEL